MERRLATILAADVVGFSRLMDGPDEEGTLSILNDFQNRISEHVHLRGGRVFGGAGDSVIAEFASPVEAVRCALEIQSDLEDRNAALPENKRMLFRIGINLGDVMAEDGNLLGDGVNIAARLEALAPPGGISISKTVAEQALGKVDTAFANAGKRELKNIRMPVEVWVWPTEFAKKIRSNKSKWRIATAVAVIAAVFVVATLGYRNADKPNDLPTGPRIAIIPFKTVGDNPEDAYFSEGLTRDLNSLLSRFSNLFVIAPDAGAAYRDKPDCEKIRDELGADFILGGAVHRSQDKLRVTTSFTDARTCRQLTPPGPFDEDMSVSNLLDIQLEIARKVAAAVGSSDAPLFNTAMQQTIRDKAPENLEAYECYLLGFWFYQTFGLEAHRKARRCLERTVEEEPGYSLGWSRLAFIYMESKKRAHDTPPDWAELSRAAAVRAIDEDRDNPDAYYALAVLSRMVGEDIEVFQNYADRAIELNPNDSWILADLGTFWGYSGDFKKGKEMVTRARALNPNLHPGYNNIWTLHAYQQGKYKDAQNEFLFMGPARNPMGYAFLAASYAMNGEQQKAENILEQWHETHPDSLNHPRAPFQARGMPPEYIESLMDGLHKAGLDVPEKSGE
jgi:adenylate cyclase